MKIKYDIILIVFIALLTYISVIDNKFVFDDKATVDENRFITSLKNIPLLFSTEYFKRSGIGDYTVFGETGYRPVVTLSYFIDYALYRGKSTTGFHFTNLILHIINIIIFFLLISLLTNQSKIALTASIIYAVSPSFSEAVNCVSFREDILCSIFFYGALLVYFKPKVRYKNITVQILYLLSLFSKEMSIAFIPVFYFICLHLDKNIKKMWNYRKIDYISLFITSFLYLSVRFYFMDNPYETTPGYFSNNMFINIGIMLKVLAGYFRIAMLPINLTAEYYIKPPLSIFDSAIILPAVIIILVFLFSVVLFFRNKDNLYYLSLVLFFVLFLPISNIIPIKNIMADRYLYLPFGFLALSLCCLFFNSGFVYKRVKLILFTALILCFINITLLRNYVWNDTFTLWSSTLKINPRSFHAHNNLASYFDSNKMFSKAEYHYKQAIKIRSVDYVPYYNLGNTYKSQGKIDEAVYYYKEAIKRDPSIVSSYVNLGLAYAKKNMLKNAEQMFRKAISINPYDSKAHNNLGSILGMMGKTSEAAKEHIIAIKIDPQNQNAYLNLAFCYMENKDYKQAIYALDSLIKINWRQPNAYYYRGQCFEALSDIPHAVNSYENVLRLNPKHHKAYERLRILSNM